MDSELDAPISETLLDQQPLIPVDYDDATRIQWTAVAIEDLRLYQAINSLHSVPGAKFRNEKQIAGASLLCEVDQLVPRLSGQLRQQAIERSRNILALHFADLQALARQ